MSREVLVLAAVVLLGGALALTGAFGDDGPRIVGARGALAAGTRVTLGDVTAIERPTSLPAEQAIRLERASMVIGATLVRDVPAGAPITLEDVGQARPLGPNLNRQRRAGSSAVGSRGTRGALRRSRCSARRARAA